MKLQKEKLLHLDYLDRGEGGTGSFYVGPEVADLLDVLRQGKCEGSFVDGGGNGTLGEIDGQGEVKAGILFSLHGGLGSARYVFPRPGEENVGVHSDGRARLQQGVVFGRVSKSDCGVFDASGNKRLVGRP